MDPRQHREALQASLRAAQAAIAAGDRIKALEAVDVALAVDPQFLAAQSLRDRLADATDAALVAPLPTSEAPGAPNQAPDSVEQYARFEARARNRRVQKRLEAARDAVAHAQFDQASAAVDELRELDPTLAELPALTLAIDRAQAPPKPGNRSRKGGATLAAALVIAGLIFGVWLFPGGALPAASNVISSWLGSPPPVPPAPARAIESFPLNPIAIATPLEHIPAPIGTDGDLEPRELPSEASLPSPLDDVPAAAPSRPILPPAVVTLPQPTPSSSDPPVVSLAPPVVPPPATPTASVPAIPRIDEEQLVRQTLQRYRWAYEELDAESAHAVWPGVDRAALARAFDGLASQALTFENCDVQVDRALATAVCTGAVRYVPKVGSREPRTEPRRWNFALRKIEADWQIESAVAGR